MARFRKVEAGAAIPVQIVGSDVPFEITSKTLTTWNGTRAVAGDNQLVAAPGGSRRIIVTAFVIQNESTTPLIMRLRSGTTANGWRCLGQNQGDGLAMTFGPDSEWRLHPNDPLNLELSDNRVCAISISYYIE